ncbi:hypothetical protein O181_013460 [Austropuccinia psidii MF-1]|uniref:Uncharacterized protein n=1 Tax=Austropuccinia psidii MF-1 TaxID=1389203 RepID=A0A9Q3BZX6_9BASI|nr:hypothetical protein [Austropuccinia psidii MF-1]
MVGNHLFDISTLHATRPALLPPGHILHHWPLWTILNPTTHEAKGEDLKPTNHKWAHLSPILAIIPEDPKWPKNPKTSKLPKGPSTIKLAMNDHGPLNSTHSLWKPPEETISVPASYSLSYGPHTAGTRNGEFMGIYIIMHHFSSEIQM